MPRQVKLISVTLKMTPFQDLLFVCEEQIYHFGIVFVCLLYFADICRNVYEDENDSSGMQEILQQLLRMCPVMVKEQPRNI